MKKKYYVNPGSLEISQIKYDNNDAFIIYASDDEVRSLRQSLDGMHTADNQAFWRAHVPIKPYHNDKPNDDYDAGITEAYQLIYELGDNGTREHIEAIGILGDNQM
ncbi:hydrolase [Lentibacillus amyloliquefaciens]|uniref:Hydrolase n=1 Tax=Lentibacillus amyloliquefaciens TaxID=1472767 RepID=A0A0U4FEY5_9BACI|nr:hydrolase [Lentibacillus amyloliquefaciens]ALX47246.1 hydrolase [Lentibacillus amyloliquefaciens]